MRGKVIQGWSMWSFIMASSGGDAVERKMKVTSWEVVFSMQCQLIWYLYINFYIMGAIVLSS
jgi:hypothetical protein